MSRQQQHVAKKAKQNKILRMPPKRERGFRRTGYTIAGYPYAFFGAPTLLHAKKVLFQEHRGWVETDQDCGGLLKLRKLWVNDAPRNFEVVLGLECSECSYTDSIRIACEGPRQLFNSANRRTWRLKDH